MYSFVPGNSYIGISSTKLQVITQITWEQYNENEKASRSLNDDHNDQVESIVDLKQSNYSIAEYGKQGHEILMFDAKSVGTATSLILLIAMVDNDPLSVPLVTHQINEHITLCEVPASLSHPHLFRVTMATRLVAIPGIEPQTTCFRSECLHHQATDLAVDVIL